MEDTSEFLRLVAKPVPPNLEREQKKREEALRRYAPLVKYVVDKVAAGLPRTVDKEDLISTAIIGLYDALEKFDADRGTKFETYAIWRIKGAVLDELRSLDWASRTIRRKARQVEKTCRLLDQQLGRPACDEEVARAMSMRLTEYHKLLDDIRGSMLLSLDSTVTVDDEHELSGLSDMIQDAEAIDALEQIETTESRDLLLRSVNALSEQERLVLALYYYEEMTLKEIGETLNISESRVSQIHTKAVQRLRTRLRPLLQGESMGCVDRAA
ncbi:MAG: FliA/WhiG family RNA polymerase sigma factor [Candidatus Eisenbacteria bacterium]|uniref:FliA/WhiG family RNA polymerase sigma factor n=1 Tax=Eiseniibacteriota bacterium TaxID=2212470 RepID=A0A948S1L0_UNCEI|nr:FliA/WhiG family RNA polymerase sigma factor [Candidatus Eisenbacteria bacterium]MBU1950963.1 FliA/WhiG family RNA polymerase sigma factor [Candidatus Eisenbacteria bacterium]MBU2692164.1 FliA/WhiG family RNA polymerase sigma factor [Candidatus Eisenbacteria bacterium]